VLHRLSEHLQNLGRRLHSFSLGSTLALLAVLLGQMGQSCAITGQ
jgi:hypothetical protein